MVQTMHEYVNARAENVSAHSRFTRSATNTVKVCVGSTKELP